MKPNSDVAVSLKNVSKTFYLNEDRKFTLRSAFASMFNHGKTKKFEALKDITVDIKKGDFFGIVGRNGSGKSTLLKIIAGILEPDKGSAVKVNGKLVPFLELGVGFNTDLSGKENIYLNGTILGMTREYINENLEEIIDFAELREFIDTPVKNYSSGMMLRLAFSIAVKSKADIYILDEILSVGDALFQQKSLKTINELKKQGKTILYVTHSMGDVAKYCNRAMLINNSHLITVGNPADVIEEYKKVNEERARKLFAEENKEIEKNSPMAAINGYQITNVKLLDKDGKESYLYKTNDEMTIQLNYKILSQKDIINCDLGIHSIDDSTLVTAVNTFRDEFKLDPSKDRIEVKFKDLKLNNGEYFIGAQLFGIYPSDNYHIMPFTVKFKVDNQRKWPGGGRIQMDYDWRN